MLEQTFESFLDTSAQSVSLQLITRAFSLLFGGRRRCCQVQIDQRELRRSNLVIERNQRGLSFELSNNLSTFMMKCVWLVILFNVFERSLFCSPRLHLFDQKYFKNSKIVKYFYNLKWLFSISVYNKILFISVIKAEFSASLLQSSVSHDPSEIILICWFDAQETFIIIIINVENSWAA